MSCFTSHRRTIRSYKCPHNLKVYMALYGRRPKFLAFLNLSYFLSHILHLHFVSILHHFLTCYIHTTTVCSFLMADNIAFYIRACDIGGQWRGGGARSTAANDRTRVVRGTLCAAERGKIFGNNFKHKCNFANKIGAGGGGINCTYYELSFTKQPSYKEGGKVGLKQPSIYIHPFPHCPQFFYLPFFISVVKRKLFVDRKK